MGIVPMGTEELVLLLPQLLLLLSIDGTHHGGDVLKVHRSANPALARLPVDQLHYQGNEQNTRDDGANHNDDD